MVGENAASWNSDNAVCWHRRRDWLTVEALPLACVVLRRSAFLKAGGFSERCERGPLPVDLDFCKRLSAHGLKSICNQSVTAEFPAAQAASELEPAFGMPQALRVSEDGR